MSYYSTNITNRNSEHVIPKEEAEKLLSEAPEGGQVEEVSLLKELSMAHWQCS